jgi:endonuclease/exonuclease/phosphatase (EEP) superfamily protein YafD
MLGSSSETHREQRDIVAGLLRDASGPALIGGDFNTRDHASLARQFAGAGFATAQQTQTTWRRMPFVLDHVFYNASLRCVGHEVCPTMTSDHHALVADFEFAG